MPDFIYLDHNATTPVRPEVIEAVQRVTAETYGNPSSVHRIGQAARKALEDAREEIADLLGARPAEVIFTSGGTESNNFGIRGLLGVAGRLAVSRVEHHSVLRTAEVLAEDGRAVRFLDVDGRGRVDPETLAALCLNRGDVVSIQHANNETGVIQDIPALAERVRSKGALFHTDGCQSAGKVPVRFDELGADALGFAAHKFQGPKGIGGLLLREGIPLLPEGIGGRQERGRRAGTENVAGAVGMAVALRLACAEMDETLARQAALKGEFLERVRAEIPDAVVNGEGADTLPNTINLGFPGLEAQDLVMGLDLRGIAVSAGAACDSGAIEISHVLEAMGVPRQVAAGSIRISMGRDTRREDLEGVLEAIKDLRAALG